MKRVNHNEDGFTGLEAAIVLIAFVVVAAVFSYVVLGAGFFTTQKSQETVHTAVGQASSTLELSGPVTVQAEPSGTIVGNATFYLQLAAGGTPVDLSKVTYTLSTKDLMYTTVDIAQGTSNMSRSYVSASPDNDNLLEANEMVLVDLNMIPIAAIANTKFTIEVKPDKGAALPITKTAPAALTADKYYEVY